MNGRWLKWRPALFGAGVLALFGAVLAYQPATAWDNGTWTMPYTGSASTTGTAFEVDNTSTSSTGAAVYGNSVAGGGSAVVGLNTGTSGDAIGVNGQSSGSPNSVGVDGYSTGSSGYAGYFHNTSTSTSGVPVGVYGESDSGTGYGLYGYNAASSGSGIGVYGSSSSGTGAGVYGTTTSSSGYAVYGTTSVGADSGYFINTSSSGNGVYANGYTGVSGVGTSSSSPTGAVGVYGTSSAGYGVEGNSSTGTAIFGGGGGAAGSFQGDVSISGALSVSGTKHFKIDHPLDPANKYLVHSCIESNEMMDLYRGNVTLDSDGRAIVQMPNWFQALNRDFSYQLTCVGGYAPVYVSQEIEENYFEIAGGKPGLKVSWEVTGVRQDAYAKAHPLIVEEDKGKDRGKYVDPKDYGKPDSFFVSCFQPPHLHHPALSATVPAPVRSPVRPRPIILKTIPAPQPPVALQTQSAAHPAGTRQ